jgi:hypothetical protein
MYDGYLCDRVVFSYKTEKIVVILYLKMFLFIYILIFIMI